MRKRAFIIGTIFSAGIAVFDPYFMLRGITSRFSFEYWAPLAIFLLFLLLALSCIHRFFELKKAELLLIFIMASIASVLPGLGFMQNLMSVITGMPYFASPVNQWAELIIEKTSRFMVIQDKQAVAYYYEGLPPGEVIPYMAWIKPLGFTLLLVLAFSFLSICFMVLFRKQWIEKEKLIYPLTILPLEMIKKEKGSRIPVLFKDKLFWTAFVLVFVFYLFNWLSMASTGSKMLELSGGISFFRRTIGFSLRPYFPLLGLAYLVPRSVSLSLWLFHVLFTVQNGLLLVSGFTLPGSNVPYGARSALVTFQSGGAMMMLVIALFWRARKHLGDCFRKAFNRNCDIDDSDELLSYRTAVFGVIISFLAMAGFMIYFGMPWLVALIFMFFVLVVLVGLTRIVCQTGLPVAAANCTPPAYTTYLLPPSAVTEQGYIAMGFQYTWANEVRTSIMASTGHALKIQEDGHIPRGMLFAGIITAIVLSYAASSYMYIHSAYLIGATNVGRGGAGMSGWIANDMLSFINRPLTGDIIGSRYIFTGVGALIMGVLMFCHSKFLWWPIHYIGFPIADSIPLRRWWFAIFIAWLIKGLILKFGGHNVYKKSVPFFLGLIMSNIVWIIVEVLLNFVLKTGVSIGWTG